MKLRKLDINDAPLMLEWMHDKDVTMYLMKDFADMTEDDCIGFIETSKKSNNNIHFAVVDDNDEYMGTVSLKNIDLSKGMAEFAITMRKSAQGKGFARYGMKEMIRYGINEIGLKSIYWDVLKRNSHAVNFYRKIGGKEMQPTQYILNKTELNNHPALDDYLWFYSDEELV